MGLIRWKHDSEYTAMQDKSTLKAWEDRLITTRQALREIAEHNGIDPDDMFMFTAAEAEDYFNSLGYIRGVKP